MICLVNIDILNPISLRDLRLRWTQIRLFAVHQNKPDISVTILKRKGHENNTTH